MVGLCAATLAYGQSKPAPAKATPAKSAPAKAVAKAPAAAANSAPAGKSFFDKPTLEAYVRHLFVWPAMIQVAISDPKPAGVDKLSEVTVTASYGGASQAVLFLLSADGTKAMQASVYDVALNPFKKENDKLKTELQPAFGTPGASVVVVIFSDFQCPFCKEEAKMIRDNVLRTYPKDVRVYFKDFPLEQIHQWAKPAAIAGRCIFRQDPAKFWNYHDWLFQSQEATSAENLRNRLQEFATGEKLNTAALLQCFDTKATEAEVVKSQEEGRSVGVNSTPTLFVNGRKLSGNLQWEQLKQIIDFELEYQKTAKNAGENCGCELKIPSPLNP